MPLFEVHFRWHESGLDSAVVEGKNPAEAWENFREKFGTQFSRDEVVSDALFVEPLETEPYQYSKYPNDDYEIIL